MKRKVQNIKKGTVGVYIPAEIRDDLHIKPQDIVDFSVDIKKKQIIMTLVNTSEK